MQIPAPQQQQQAPVPDASTQCRTKNSESSVTKAGHNRHTALFKTELCRSFQFTGRCRYGSKCQFAHGEEEMRSPAQHYKYKTEPCKWFDASGSCPFGDKCRFIHRGEDDSRVGEEQQAGPSDRPVPDNRVSIEAAFVGGGATSPGALPGLVFSCHSSTRQRRAESASAAASAAAAETSLLCLPLFRSAAAKPSAAADLSSTLLLDVSAPASPRSPTPLGAAPRGLPSLASSCSVLSGSSSSDAMSSAGTASIGSASSSRRGSGDGALSDGGAGAWHRACAADAAQQQLPPPDWTPISGGFPNPFLQASLISPTPSPPQHGLGVAGLAAAAGVDSLFQAAPALKQQQQQQAPLLAGKPQQQALGRPIDVAMPVAVAAALGATQGQARPQQQPSAASALPPIHVLQQQLAMQRNQLIVERLRLMQDEERERVLQWQLRERLLQQMLQEHQAVGAMMGASTDLGLGAGLLGQQQPVLF